MKNKFRQIVLLFIICCFGSCGEKKWEADTSVIEVDLDLQRFELDMLTYAESGINEVEIKELSQQYPKFYPLYYERIMQFGASNSVNSSNVLNDFLSNQDIRELFEVVNTKFPRTSLQEEEEKLNEAFKKYRYYFPELIVPKVRTMLSAFNYSIATADSLLVIGLDNYLGSDFKLYPKIGLPAYKFEKFEKEYIVMDAMKAWLTTEFEEKEGQNLLEKMIFNGKILFLLKVMLPNEDSWLKFSYNKNELEWCENNESEIWFHLVDMELFFTSENFKIRKYLGDAPFITGFPEGSPGKVGQWVGYKIVEAYMKEHPELSLKELMLEDSGNRFLQASNYKPKRR